MSETSKRTFNPDDLQSKLSGPALPGATLGIFGGGQLGRMMGIAARSMGYKVHVLDPDPACPAGYIADTVIEAGWNDRWAAANLSRECSAVTLEIEQVAISSLEMDRAELAMRALSAMAGVDFKKLQSNELHEGQWARVAQAQATLDRKIADADAVNSVFAHE